MQDWSRVSQESKDRKNLKRKKSRDEERERKIEDLGGKRVHVDDVNDYVRSQRKEYLYTLMYPERHIPKHKRSYVIENKRKYTRKGRPKGAERTEEQFLSGVVRTIKAKAKRDNLNFDLEVSKLKVPEVCPVLGVPLDWGAEDRDTTPSIDRLIPDLGYVLSNVRIVSHRANRLKQDATVEELEKILLYLKEEDT